MRRRRQDSVSETDEQRPIKQSFCGSLRRDTHWKCLLLSALIYTCLSTIGWCRFSVRNGLQPVTIPSNESERRGSPCNDGYIYIPVAFVIMLYLVYLVECWHCHTRIELQHKVDVGNVYERVQVMRESMPVIWWKAICYHYVRRTRQVTRYRNGDAFTTTQVYYERINTHTAGSAFDFAMCGLKDLSKYLEGLEAYPATKIRFSKGFSFNNWASENEFERQRSDFFRDNERRDDYMETREGMDLLNVHFKEYLIAFADADNQPWYVSHVLFWVISLLLLSWPLRVLIEYKTAYVHYHVHKQFGGNYDSNQHITTATPQTSTFDYTDIEMAIFHNYAIVPSYSEALLMGNGCAAPNAYFPNTYGSDRHSRSISYNNFVAPNKRGPADRPVDGLSNPGLAQSDHNDNVMNSLNMCNHENYVENGDVSRRINGIHRRSSGVYYTRKFKKRRRKWRRYLSTPEFGNFLRPSSSCVSFQNSVYYDATVTQTNRYRRNSVTDEYEMIPLHEPTFIERLRQFPSSLSWTSSSLAYEQPPCYEDAITMQRLNSLTSRVTLTERESLTNIVTFATDRDLGHRDYNSISYMETTL